MYIVIGILGIVFFLALAALFSSDRKDIRWRYVGLPLIIQLVSAFILFKANLGISVIGNISNGFNYSLAKATVGVSSIFGGFKFTDPKQPSFFSSVLLPIIFASVLIGILQYTRMLPLIINLLGFLISKINGMDRLESYNVIAIVIPGQPEVFISLKKQLPYIPKQRSYTLTASAISTTSTPIMGAYFILVKPKHAVTAVVPNLFGGSITASIINPYRVNEGDDKLLINENGIERQSFSEIPGEYILDGFKVAVIAGAMLTGYIAIIALLDRMVSGILSFMSDGAIQWSLQTLIGFILAPFAFLTGIPWQDVTQSGSVMATKSLSNEFVAVRDSGKTTGLSEHAKGIISVFLISSANFSSIGIISGAIESLNDEKGDVVVRFGIKLLFGITLVSFISATIAGLFV